MMTEYPGDLRRRLHAAYDRLCIEHDRWHYYQSRRVLHIPRSDHSLEMHFELTGTNVATEPTTYLPLAIAADSPAEFDDLAITVRNRSRQRPRWKPVPMRDVIRDDPYCKTVKVRFDQPVPRRAKFSYEVQLTWPGTAATREDYVFAKYAACLRGVAHAQIEVLLPEEPDWQAGTIDEGGLFQLLDDPDVKWDDDNDVLRWDLEDPQRDIGYVLLFRRDQI
jgi:hypothetical protein